MAGIPVTAAQSVPSSGTKSNSPPDADPGPTSWSNAMKTIWTATTAGLDRAMVVRNPNPMISKQEVIIKIKIIDSVC